MYSILGKKNYKYKEKWSREEQTEFFLRGRALSFKLYTITFFKLIGANHLNSQKRFVIQHWGDRLSITVKTKQPIIIKSLLIEAILLQTGPSITFTHNPQLISLSTGSKPPTPPPPGPWGPVSISESGGLWCLTRPWKTSLPQRTMRHQVVKTDAGLNPPNKVCRWALHTFDMSKHLYTMPLCQITTLRHKNKDIN